MSSTAEAHLALPESATVLASGIGFTEGPMVLDDRHLLVASVSRGTAVRLPLDGSPPSTEFETGGGPNGLALGPNGLVLITQNGGTAMRSRSTVPAVPSIQAHQYGVLSTYAAPELNYPSDCVWGPDGTLWFTDPADHNIVGPAAPGAVRTFNPRTGEFRTLGDGYQFPNGIAFGEDPSVVYLAQTAAGVVTRHRLVDGRLEPDGWIATPSHGRPDGIALDSRGWLWVAGATGDDLTAFDTNGRQVERIVLGHGVLVTSLCFAGRDLNTLVVTIAKGGTVVALPALHPGLPLPIWR
ncbi:SMP-30/gluconolactonase/LRE family protein [Nocardioides sp. MAHUQ-72]|uniref:SMP-30/gluconolactonase/LRE family protein n=1 Tax=unclassified Nocardioides TaxID=2615069 RepID=UPI00360811A1